MVNLTHAELAEITTQSLPAASLEALQNSSYRDVYSVICSSTSTEVFT
jgi:hypothetical protein